MCMYVCVFLFFCALYLFSSDPQFIIPTTQDLMRIAKQQEELVE